MRVCLKRISNSSRHGYLLILGPSLLEVPPALLSIVSLSLPLCCRKFRLCKHRFCLSCTIIPIIAFSFTFPHVSEQVPYSPRFHSTVSFPRGSSHLLLPVVQGIQRFNPTLFTASTTLASFSFTFFDLLQVFRLLVGTAHSKIIKKSTIYICQTYHFEPIFLRRFLALRNAVKSTIAFPLSLNFRTLSPSFIFVCCQTRVLCRNRRSVMGLLSPLCF